MTIEDLLAELAADGWTLSWAFQYAPNEWRASITKTVGEWNGYDQPDYRVAHCAFAPTLAEAIEDAMCKRNDAEYIEGAKVGYSLEPQVSLADLVKAMIPKAPTAPIKRRF